MFPTISCLQDFCRQRLFSLPTSPLLAPLMCWMCDATAPLCSPWTVPGWATGPRRRAPKHNPEPLTPTSVLELFFGASAPTLADKCSLTPDERLAASASSYAFAPGIAR